MTNLNTKLFIFSSAFVASIVLGGTTPVLSLSLSGTSLTLKSAGITNDYDKISVILDEIFKLWKIVVPDGRPLEAKDFTEIKSARVLIACVNGICKKDFNQSNEQINITLETVEKRGEVHSIASISGGLKHRSIVANQSCVGSLYSHAEYTCKKTVDAVGRPGDIFVKNVTASAFGLVYDGGYDGTLLISGGEDTDEVYRAVPEPLTILGTLLAGGIGVAMKKKKKDALQQSES